MSEASDKSLEALQVWKRSMMFAVTVCKHVIPLFPPEEKWVMATQLRRAVQSIPANIAEGHGRYYFQDDVRFCYIARGSLDETYSHLTLARELNYIPNEEFLSLMKELEELRRMLNGYIAFLKRSKRGANEPGAAIAESPALYLTNSDESLPD